MFETLPEFRGDGYLPDGIHVCREEEMYERFGTSVARRGLLDRIERWIALARESGCVRFLVDGSFVTSKTSPNDVDAVVQTSREFHDKLLEGQLAAVELNGMLLSRTPAELFEAVDEAQFERWAAFFARTREIDGRTKGLVEVTI